MKTMEAFAAMGWNGTERKIWGLLLAGLLCSLATQGPAAAQSAPEPQVSLSAELTSLASRAAQVFAGQVVSVTRKGGVVEITFRVEKPVVGATGNTLTLREWAGLWPPGQFRYTIGERALVFLHGVSAAGFASSVDGAEGVVPIVVAGANAPQLLDIRRLAAAILRTPGTPLPTEADGAIQLSDAMSIVQEAPRTAGAASREGRLKPGYRLPVRQISLKGVPGTLVNASELTGTASEPLPAERLAANRLLLNQEVFDVAQ